MFLPLFHSKAVKQTVAAMKAMSITEESCSVLYLTLHLRCAIEGMTGGLGEEGRGRGDFKACFQDRIFCLNPHTGGKKAGIIFVFQEALAILTIQSMYRYMDVCKWLWGFLMPEELCLLSMFHTCFHTNAEHTQ